MQLAWGITYAQSTSYVYDANGHVVAVTASNGTSVQYTYNSLGQASQASAPVPSGQLAIFAFIPTHGEVGTQVTIQGQGFDSNAANDTVSFNGAVTTVLSASVTQLVVVVPSGATTGPISVSVGNQTATSTIPFVVDDSGLPPTITQVSPAPVSVGNTVTVMGTHLDPAAGETTVRMAGSPMTVTSATDSQLQYVVPASATSGFVTVATPYGHATSSVPLIVLPSGLSAANVADSAYTDVGGSADIAIPASGKTGTLLFQGGMGDWISLQLKAISTTANAINYAVYAPGNQLILQGTVSASAPSIHLPQLTIAGNYLVTFTPDTAGAAFTAGVERAAALASGTSLSLAIAVQGQSKRLVFQGTSGQLMTLLASGTATTPVGQALNYTVYSPGQQVVVTGSIANNGSISTPVLSATGVYQVLVSPGSGVTASTQIQLVAGDVIVANWPVSHHGGYPVGKNAQIAFTANQGDNLELTLSNVSFGVDDRFPMTVNVLDAHGTNIASGQCGQGGTCRFALWNLAQGSYSVVAIPMYNFYSIAGFDAVLQSDSVGPALSLNTAQMVTLAQGQVERFTFNGNAGDNLALNVANVSTANGTQQPVTFAVYRPDTSPITTTNAYLATSFTSSGTLNIPNLPISGNYTVIVSTSGVTATAQLTLTPTTIAENGQSAHYGGYLNGQSAGISFTANQGDNLELTLSNVSFGSDDRFPMTVNVLDAHGTNIASGQCGQGGTCRFALWNLAQGSYSVVATPMYTFYSIAGFDAVLQSDTVGPALSLNTAQTATLAQGQVERFTFNGNAGDNRVLNVAAVSTTSPTGQPVTFAVYRPDNSITPSNAYVSSQYTDSGSLSMTNLPVSGTYTVVVSTTGEPGSAQLTLQ
ncbi:IPT/TIG domain-containing protein [Burkholderia pseudomallei]